MLSSKKFITTSLILLSGLFVTQNAFAASSVYYDDDTGAYGYAYQTDTIKDARDSALKFCKDAAGTNCKELIGSKDKGYGAVAIGKDKKGIEIIGAVVAYDSLEEAKDAAIKYCSDAGGLDAKILETWEDK